jgi:hypothetical protein
MYTSLSRNYQAYVFNWQLFRSDNSEKKPLGKRMGWYAGLTGLSCLLKYEHIYILYIGAEHHDLRSKIS